MLSVNRINFILIILNNLSICRILSGGSFWKSSRLVLVRQADLGGSDVESSTDH